jgi:transposase-like protein
VTRSVEIISTVARRRRWSAEEKVEILDEAFRGGSSVAATSDRHGVSRALIYLWRRQAREGRIAGVGLAEPEKSAFVPVDGIAGNGREIKRTLARLEQGEAWVAMPPKPFRMKFRQLTTFDSSKTPAAPLPQETSPFAPDELANLVRSFEEIAEYDGVLGRSSEANSLVPVVTRLRTCSNLSQTEFAARTGQSVSNLRRYENGEVSPTVATLQEIAGRVGMQVVIDFQQRLPESARIVPFECAAHGRNES